MHLDKYFNAKIEIVIFLSKSQQEEVVIIIICYVILCIFYLYVPLSLFVLSSKVRNLFWLIFNLIGFWSLSISTEITGNPLWKYNELTKYTSYLCNLWTFNLRIRFLVVSQHIPKFSLFIINFSLLLFRFQNFRYFNETHLCKF